jgi:hypothetical protein
MIPNLGAGGLVRFSSGSTKEGSRFPGVAAPQFLVDSLSPRAYNLPEE